MKRSRGEIQVFSVSFLDLLSCALGGILVLWLLSVRDSQQKATSYARQVDSMQQQMSVAQAAIVSAQKAAAAATTQANAEKAALDGMKRAQAALIGLNGKMDGAVFIFDTSASMEATGRYDEYKALLKGWLTHLPFKRLNVIRFSDDVEIWRPGQLVQVGSDDNDPNRQSACQFVDRFVPNGSTNTRKALEDVFVIPGVDTITLMSDGRPNGDLAEMERILVWLRQVNQDGRVVINCVAMGNYFGKEYAEFLQQVAHDHKGMFIGR